jgi:hypothetical protein
MLTVQLIIEMVKLGIPWVPWSSDDEDHDGFLSQSHNENNNSDDLRPIEECVIELYTCFYLESKFCKRFERRLKRRSKEDENATRDGLEHEERVEFIRKYLLKLLQRDIRDLKQSTEDIRAKLEKLAFTYTDKVDPGTSPTDRFYLANKFRKWFLDSDPPEPAGNASIWHLKSPTGSLVCLVCWEKDRDTVFTPCGHFAYCSECSENIEECGICRQVIVEGIQVSCSAPENPDQEMGKCSCGHVRDGIVVPCGHICCLSCCDGNWCTVCDSSGEEAVKVFWA